MSDDNINNFDDDFSDEFSEEDEKHFRERKENVKNHPLMLQAKELNELISALLDTCDDSSFSELYGSTLRESAIMIMVKLRSSLDSESRLLCLQNAAIIREHGQYLRLANHTLGMSEGFDKKYVTMFREEVEKFRMLFVEWINKVHHMEKDVKDEWGLFLD